MSNCSMQPFFYSFRECRGMEQGLCSPLCHQDVGIAPPWLAEEGRRWTHLVLRLGVECPGVQGFPGCRKDPPLHTPQGWPPALGKTIFPPCHPKGCMKAYTLYKPRLMEVKEWLWPWHILSLNRSDNAFSGTLDPIICTQGNIHPLIGWPNRFDLLGLSRYHAIHFAQKQNLKQSLKLQTQKIDLKKPLSSVKSS